MQFTSFNLIKCHELVNVHFFLPFTLHCTSNLVTKTKNEANIPRRRKEHFNVFMSAQTFIAYFTDSSPPSIHLFIYSNTTNVRRSKAFYEKCDVSKYVRVIAIAKMNLDNRRENMSIHFIILHFSFI